MIPLTKAILSPVCLIATDMDGTLTKNGKFTSELLIALESLAVKNIPVLIVTGRSAGWVSAIANYLPIVGAIAENGGLFYNNQDATSELITNLDNLESHRWKLKEVFQLLQSKFPEIIESADNSFRITDWTFDIGELTPPQLETMNRCCQDRGYGFTYSTVQCHIKPKQQDKAYGLQQILNKHFSHLTPQQVVTVGDSPNDESLFNQNYFPLSVGVANIVHYSDRLQHQPTYITSFSEAQGFCELAKFFT
ncbi:HAD-superfamily hydrolase, subfamily IIB [Hyella patelloides LEGE 07179]|uniref:HAD-superfamily hydrolase, subfamily IIB n=1 Tax=Hyella patelloides LEGE 07179 TaxID=945734 RepID=A0A563VU83_9CYAN|nr:HAD family hydrolase [Hyella patelloides]VEP14821.1 HAD-superfamily hydrolase, subfamily IIB [Hyella patelloides LEGE 07179]